MSFVDKIKNKVQTWKELSVPAHFITQPIPLPLYEIDLNSLIDPNVIAEKCLDTRAGENSKPELVKDGWQSPYYYHDSKEFELFAKLIEVVENKLNDTTSSIKECKVKYHVHHFWFVVYGEGTYHKWHNHSADHISFSGVYYPIANENAAPIEFENENSNLSIPTKTGKLLLFPSVLKHRVPECTSSEVRIAVSFNFISVNG
jgi:hypothetical protein